MTEFREYFLNLFDKHIATGIIEFGKKLSNTKADVFVLMARKSACFIECLEELTLTKIEGHVTTDRALDMNLQWLKNKDVVIVDDAIVSGTTIYETINILKNAEVKSIRVIVLCINKEWFTPELLFDEENKISYLQEPYLNLKNEECIKLCFDIVTALSIFPRPYAVDFPLYSNTRIPEQIFDIALINSYWECDEVTSSLQQDNNVISLTITPKISFLHCLDEAIGFPISKMTFCKVRIYGKLIEKGRSTYSRNHKSNSNATNRNIYILKILPIVVFKSITYNEINNLFDSVVKHFSDYKYDLEENFISSQSKLRLLQHIAANYLGRLWIDQITNLTESKISLIQDSKALGFLYPPHLISLIKQISSQNDSIFQNTKLDYIPNLSNKKIDYSSSIQDVNLISINAKLTEPFINLYYNKELKARDLVKKYGKKVFINSEYKSLLSRLKKGFSIKFLNEIVSEYSERFDTAKIVSLFLDKSIDMGIVVPITGEKDGVLFRAYRHGEDVIFGEYEEKLCYIMLKNFSNSTGKPIPHIWAEKLLVLLLKIGVQKKFLREFIYDNPPKEVTRIVSVRNYLYGQVAAEQIVEPTDTGLSPVYLNEDQKSKWLSNILLEKKYIKKVGKEAYYEVEEIETIGINSVAELESENIGDIFGTLYLNQDKPKLTRKDLVLFTSCLNPNDISASMAAEIFIFRDKWERYKSFIVREAQNERKHYEIIRSIRHSNKLWTAINSGQDKYKDFISKKGIDRIQEITSELSSNKFMARTWQQFWSANIGWDETSIHKDLKDLIENQAQWLFKTNIYLRTLDLLFRKINQLSGGERIVLEKLNLQLKESSRILKDTKDKIKDKQNEQNATSKELLDSLKNKEKKYKLEVDNCTNEIADIANGTSSIILEVDDKLNDLLSISHSISKPTIDFFNEVRRALQEADIESFKKYKLINTNVKLLDECSMQSKILLDKVDIIVSSFGKVEYAIEYNHSFFIDFTTKTDSDRQVIEHIIFNTLLEFEKDTFRFKEKSTSTTASFYMLPNHNNGIKRGVWIIGRGAFAKARLVKLMLNIFAVLKKACDLKIIYFPDLPSNSTISIQAKNSNNIKFGFFYERSVSIIEYLLNKYGHSSELFVVSSKPTESDIVKEVTRDSESFFTKDDSEDFHLRNFNSELLTITKFNLKGMQENFDIGIITIVAPEKNAIDGILQNLKIENGKKTTRKYSKGFLTGAGKHSHSVVMTQQLLQGNEDVMNAYHDLNAEFKPKLMVLFGIAGSISKENKLCDVCIVNQVIDYDKRKDKGNDIVENRGSTFRVPAKILVYLNEFFNKYGEAPRFKASKDSLENTFEVQIGPIGSGNAVIGNPTSSIKIWLKDFNSKVIAVETEAVGFSTAYYSEELNRTNNKVGAVIFRGISDHADFDKNDKWRIPAAKNAAIAFKEFVKLLPDLTSLISE